MKTALSLLLLAALYTSTLCQNGHADVKQTIAVLDFASVGSEEHLGKAVAEIIRAELLGVRRFRVVERAQIAKALQEQHLQQTGIEGEKGTLAIGKMLGADLIIIGSVVKIGTAYTINSQMLDIRTGEATLGKNVTGNDLNLLTNLSRSLLDNLFAPGKKTPARQPNEPEITLGKMEQGVDRPGLDYAGIELSRAEPQLCQSSCSADARCKAWTYVRPGTQGSQAMCWLKERVPLPTTNGCCVSGTFLSGRQ